MRGLNKLTNYQRKRELCLQIVEAYRKRAMSEMQDASKRMGDFKSRSPALYKTREGMNLLGILGTAFSIAEVHQIGKYGDQIKKYEELANSKILYFVRTSKLEKVLKELPLPQKEETLNVKMPSGKVKRWIVS